MSFNSGVHRGLAGWLSRRLHRGLHRGLPVVRALLGSSPAAVGAALEAGVRLTDKDIIFCARGVELLRKAADAGFALAQ